MKLRVLIFTLSILLSSQAWSIGDEKENGGDIVFCDINGSQSYLLLDLYEAQALHNLTLVTAQSNTKETIFEERMQSLEKVDPTRANLYRGYMKSFFQEARFVDHSDFSDIVDEGDFKALPKGCNLRQIIAQYDQPTPDGIRFMVNQDLWNHLDEENRAALLIHEFIYREGRQPQNNFRTSSGVRYLNALIHSTKMLDMSIENYIQRLRAVGMQEVTVQGQPLVLFTWNADKTQKIYQNVEFHANGKVEHATLASHFQIPGIGQVACRQEIKNEHSISFFDSGAVATIHVGCENMAYAFYSYNTNGYIFGSTFTYDENGHILNVFAEDIKGTIFQYSSATVHITGMLFQQPNTVSVTFYANGTPKTVWMSNKDSWTFQKRDQNQWSPFTPFDDTVYFTPDGDLQNLAP